ncbi:hypothetical protein NPIL_472701 [Nephila pilipes]|uniref:Uncharacterized protein n=1 Tax=Nephila pilipes TaxID=299642 RepID=A0A8X6TTE8_NEPPI|nr:hypothetical protein NPIL_472701 [Nephila pilipes]
MSICDEPLKGRSHAFDDETLQTAIEENRSITYCEFSKPLTVSDETVRLHLHLSSKTYRPRKANSHCRPILEAIETCATGIASKDASTSESQSFTLPLQQRQTARRVVGEGQYAVTWLGNLVLSS